VSAVSGKTSGIRITALRWVPAPFQGQVRDLAVRWALEETGAAYEVKLLAPGEQVTPEYRAWHPFGKVPAYEEDGLTLFESGAIVLHVSENTALLPTGRNARARVTAWVIAALNSVDPDIIALGDIDHFAADEAWARQRRPALEGMLKTRLNAVAAHLRGRDYLVDTFSAADIMMITILRALRHTTLVADIPTLCAYRNRCEARPAFERALTAQLDTFARHSPT
jgi:glutathione S-transferase